MSKSHWGDGIVGKFVKAGEKKKSRHEQMF